MNSWELARYLIDAKKDVDSLMFIKDNIDELSNIDIYNEIKKNQTDFYLNLCFVLDNVYNNKTKKNDICKSNHIINSIYYERDKDKAHKDENYKKTNYSTIDEIINIMTEQVVETQKICSTKLPEVLTLDFVPHDKNLFRLINGLTKNKENEINNMKYEKINCFKNIDKQILNDIDDLKNIPEEERKNYAVVIKDGINLYEGIQERQDSLIKLNALYGGNLWCEFNKKARRIVKELLENNLIDKFMRPLDATQITKEKIVLFNNIMNEEE